jgi:membrane protein involved in colicin uptake
MLLNKRQAKQAERQQRQAGRRGKQAAEESRGKQRQADGRGKQAAEASRQQRQACSRGKAEARQRQADNRGKHAAEQGWRERQAQREGKMARKHTLSLTQPAPFCVKWVYERVKVASGDSREQRAIVFCTCTVERWRWQVTVVSDAYVQIY